MAAKHERRELVCSAAPVLEGPSRLDSLYPLFKTLDSTRLSIADRLRRATRRRVHIASAAK